MSDKIDNKSFVHLHVHSFYSLLDGLSSPKKLVEVAVENGFKALAITDHGCCGGLLVFQKACKDAGIKPLLGCEMYITSDMMFKEKTSVNHHLILLAKNTIGLKNLMRLASIAEIDGKYRKPRIDFAVLEKHHEGLICTSACPNGELSNLLFNDRESEAEALALKYKALFGEDYYIEVMRHVYNEKEQAQEKKEHSLSIKLYNLGNKLGIKVVATNDVHYAKKSDSKYHDILLSIQTIDTVKNPERFTFNSEDFYLKTQNEMLELFKDMPDTVYNTVEIANKIEDNLLKKSDDLLPVFKIPEGFTDEKHYLKELVRDGMKAKGLINKPEYRERIRFEMDLIIKCNYVRYFLILWDILNFAKRENIRVGAGRGCFLPGNIVECKEGNKNIEDIKISDKVLSYDGKYHEVINTLTYDINEEIIEIEMEDGRKISCTSDHKIHVKREKELVWIKACDLTENDDIYDINIGD